MLISAWINLLPVGGTWYRKHQKAGGRQWCDAGSHLWSYLRVRGFRWLIAVDGRRFDWTGRVNGWQFWRRWTRWFRNEPDFTDWENDGRHLYNTVDPPFAHEHALPGRDLHIWAHSHGGNVVFHACALGLKVNTLVLFCTPVRKDMLAIIAQARANIGCVVMVYSNESDLMQLLGGIGDGHLGVERRFDHDGPCEGEHVHLVDKYVFVDDGHSGVLNDAARFERLNPILKLIEARHGRADFLARPTADEIRACGFD